MSFVPCEQCPLRRKLRFKPFTAPELGFVRALKSGQIDVAPGQAIIAPDGSGAQLYTLFSGWAFRYRIAPDGQRQIVDVLLPGSLIGLQQFMLSGPRSGVESLTRVTLCVLGGRPLNELFVRHAELAEAMVLTLMEDGQRIDVRLALLARRSGPERLAYFLLDLFDRLTALGMAEGEWCYFPLQRRHLADLLGLSDTHVSRSMQELRRRKLAAIASHALSIFDRPGMSAFSGYVEAAREPRLLL